MKRVLWIVLSVVLLAAMALSIVRLVTADSPTVPRPADIEKVQRTATSPPGTPGAGAEDPRDPGPVPDPARLVGGNGVVEPDRQQIDVSAEVPGRVARVLAVEGTTVEAGAPLVELEASVEVAAVAVAEAELASAGAQRDKVLEGNRAEDVRAAVSEAREAQARAALSKGVLERTKRLADGGGATADELDRARRQAEADAYAAQAAGARRAASVKGSREADILEAEAAVRGAEARLAEARARLGQRTVRAPEAGEVLQVKVRPGEYLQPGGVAPVVLGDTRHLTVRVDVDERDVARVRVGAAATVRAKAFGDREFTGRVRELGHRMGRKNIRTDDPTERNDTKILEVVVALDGHPPLIVGQQVVARIEGAAAASAPTR